MTETMICRRCGEVFEENELGMIHGDVICGITVNGDPVCPNCRSEDFCEAVLCAVCGEWFIESETVDGVCHGCIEKTATPENVINFCDEFNEKTDVGINFAAVSILSAAGIDIDRLVTRFALETAKDPCCKGSFKRAAEECAAKELDTGAFVRGVLRP